MIYCNGDSNTAGTELIDYEYFKDSYPGFFNKDYIKTLQYVNWWHTNAFKWYFSGSLLERNKIKEKEKLKAWPAKLETILNVPVINAAFMGEGIESVVRATIKDILTSKTEIKVAIIQCPPAERVEVFYEGKFYSIQLSHKTHSVPAVNNLLQLLARSETDFSLHRRYLFSLMQLHDFCKNKNIKLLIVPVDNSYLNFDSKLSYIKEYISESMYPHAMRDEVEKITGDVYCPGAHFTEKVHDSFAESLTTYIKEQKIL